MNRSLLKSLAALVVTAAGTGFVLGFKTSDAGPTPTAAASTGSRTGTGSTGMTGATTTRSTGSSATASPSSSPSGGSGGVASASTYADGSWTGPAINEPWGTFQVQVVVSGGQITDVNILSAPLDGHSSSINSFAVPRLTQAVIAAQSANVDMISGATWTSHSYLTSLQAALDSASTSAGNSQG